MHTSTQLKRGRDFALPAELSLSLFFFESKLSVPRSALVSSVSRRAYLYAPSLTSRIPLPLLRRFFLLRPLLSLPCREREGENSERPSSEREPEMGNICGGSGKAHVAEDFRPSSPGEEGRSQEPVFILLSPVIFSCVRFNSWILLRLRPYPGQKKFLASAQIVLEVSDCSSPN